MNWKTKKNPPSNAGDKGLMAGWGTRMPKMPPARRAPACRRTRERQPEDWSQDLTQPSERREHSVAADRQICHFPWFPGYVCSSWLLIGKSAIFPGFLVMFVVPCPFLFASFLVVWCFSLVVDLALFLWFCVSIISFCFVVTKGFKYVDLEQYLLVLNW